MTFGTGGPGTIRRTMDRMMKTHASCVLVLLAMVLGCGDDAGPVADAGIADAIADAPTTDGGPVDAGPLDLQALVDDVLTRTGVPALAVAIVDEDGVVDGAAGGVRRLGDPTRATFDDRFHLGSNTKAMTATVAAMLVDDGMLTWETTIDDVFGEDVEVHADFRTVTLEELLSHRAGIDDFAVYGRLGEIPEEVVAGRREGTAQTVSVAPDAPRGAYLYSNVGYVIAGAMMETVTGASWESLVQDRLFTPLGMSSCGFGAPIGEVDQPWGHADGAVLEPIDPNVPDEELPPVLGPAGSTLHCALVDWAKFVSMNLRGHGATGDGLVSPEGFEAIRTPHAEDYGLGWVVIPDPLRLVHDGSNTRFYSLAVLSPTEGWALLVVTNVGGDTGAGALEAVLSAFVASRGEDG